MPDFIQRWLPNNKNTLPVNRYSGFNNNGIIITDRRGTKRTEMPETAEKAFGMGSDPLAIYRPAGAKTINAAKAMAAFTGWTFAAVNAIASEVANIDLRLYRVTGDKHEEITDHPLLDLLDGVNEQMTGIEFKYTMMAHLELTGNFFCLLEGVNNDTTPPRALYPLNPGSVRVKINKSTFPYKLSHYEYTIDGTMYSFKPYEVLHVKYPDPNDPFVGIGVPQTIPTWIDNDNYAMEYNRKFFQNGASIGLYIQTETNVEGNLDRIKTSFRNEQAGVQNAHKIPVLPKGAKLEHTGVTHKDMDFATLTDATRDRILAGFRVSKTILGTAESDTNRATAETADYVFSKRTIKPKMLLVNSYLNEYLVGRYGDDLYLTFIDPTPEDKQFRTQEMAASVASMPIMTQNEARRSYLGLGPVEGGDALMRPSTMEPAGTTTAVEGEDQTPQLAKTAEGRVVKTRRIRTGGKSAHNSVKSMQGALSKAFAKIFESKTKVYESKSLSDLTHTEYMEHWKRFADSAEAAEAKLKAVFDGINAKQREVVIANLPAETGITKGLDELFDLNEWIKITIDLATPILTALTKDEAAAAFSMIGAASQNILADEATADALDAGIAKMATSYNETTLTQLKNVLTEKLTQDGGTNLTELTQAVDGVYSFADSRRAGLIAKTESFRAANSANKAAWLQSGVVKTVKWYTSEKDNVCEFCQELNGKEIPIDDNFYDAGDTIVGKDGGSMTANYGDIEAPPVHPLCSCYIRPESISIE
jgi:HK97 family phage portal protein